MSVDGGDDEILSSLNSLSVQDESSQSSPQRNATNGIRTSLEEFRENWQRELKGQTQEPPPAGFASKQNVAEEPLDNATSPDGQQQALAESLFRTAVELEQRGKVYDALPFYKKAVQIVPDIEFKFYEHQNGKIPPTMEGGGAKSTSPMHTGLASESSEEEVLDESTDLYEKFQLDLERDCEGKLLMSNYTVGVVTTELHISDLPPELLLYILRWVVSKQLDMRSLEQCALVSKGMYLLARDEELWRLACANVWGVNVGTLATDAVNENEGPSYTTWRQMFIERERVLFNGCYISKTTYLRMGENSFQDQYYRPVQLVEYFRYVRFLPNGTVVMMTTADEPALGVNKLRYVQQLRNDILRGHYHLYGSTVTVILTKQPRAGNHYQYPRQRHGSSSFADESNSTKYCIEFRIVNTPKRKFSQLVWTQYSIVQVRNKLESTSAFDLTAAKYPALWFSPVRSYHLDADAPLA